MRYPVLVAILLGLFSTGAEARQRTYVVHEMCNILWPCEGVAPSPRGLAVVKSMRGFGVARPVYTPYVAPAAKHARKLVAKQYREVRQTDQAPRQVSREVAVVEHPTGCPRTAFCGCGAAVRLLGAPVRSLWLASNWFRFSRTTPAPNMAGVTSHHVIALIEQRHGSVWLVYDANSGRGLTRIHEVDISRYTIVNPRL